MTNSDSENPVPEIWRKSFLDNAQPVQVKRGQTIIAQGSSSSDVFYIMDGNVQFSLVGANGKQTVFGELGAGHIFGEMAAIDVQPRSVSVLATEDCELAKLPADDFLQLLSDEPGASLWIAKQLSSRTRNLTERSFELATMPIAARLQSELLRLAEKNINGSDVCVIEEFPTHAALAARIGTHREAITRELRTLSSEGIISQDGRIFRIESIQKLREVA